MKKSTKTILGVLAVVVVAAILLVVYFVTRPQASGGDKTITVEVVHSDESSETFTYDTDAEYLGEVLQEEGLVANAAMEGRSVTIPSSVMDKVSADGTWAGRSRLDQIYAI